MGYAVMSNITAYYRVKTVLPCVLPSHIARKASFPRSMGRTLLSQDLFSISKIDAHQLDPILKLSLGTEKQRSKDMRRHRTILTSCMRTDRAYPKTTLKPPLGFAKLQIRDLSSQKEIRRRSGDSEALPTTGGCA